MQGWPGRLARQRRPRDLGEKTEFHLRLLKRFHRKEETLLRGEVDFLVLSAVDFLRAQQGGAVGAELTGK